MRILIHDFAGHPFQIQLSRTLADRGHQVLHAYCDSLVTPQGNFADSNGKSSNLAIEGIRLDAGFEKYALHKRWQSEHLVGEKLAELVRRYDPEIVVSGNTPLAAQARLLKASKRADARFVYWMQDAFGIGYRNMLRDKLSLPGDWLGRGFQAWERRLLSRSDEVIVIADEFRSYLPRKVRARNSATVIENWAPLEELPLRPKQNHWSKAHGLDSSRNFIYSGTLGFKHNPGLLYNLARSVADQQNARVVVISEGPGANWLARRKREEGLDNLVLLPFQPFEDMPEVLASADVLMALLEKDAGVFAVPSKVLTYLCARRPLLLAVPPENLSARIVRDNRAGVTSSPEDAEAFNRAGRDLLANSALCEQLAENGRAYAEKTFNPHLIANRFETIMHRLASPAIICPGAEMN